MSICESESGDEEGSSLFALRLPRSELMEER